MIALIAFTFGYGLTDSFIRVDKTPLWLSALVLGLLPIVSGYCVFSNRRWSRLVVLTTLTAMSAHITYSNSGLDGPEATTVAGVMLFLFFVWWWLYQSRLVVLFFTILKKGRSVLDEPENARRYLSHQRRVERVEHMLRHAYTVLEWLVVIFILCACGLAWYVSRFGLTL